MPKLKIGIVGCGAIGSSLAVFISKELNEKAKLTALYDIEDLKAQKLSDSLSKKNNLCVDSLNQLIKKSELVIESAKAARAWAIASATLKEGRDVMIMSVGGVARKIKELSLLAKRHKGRVYIPSGAICGIDALKAANLGKIKKVTLTTRKNPLSFKGVEYLKERGIRLDKIKKDKVLFSGPAAEAIKYFPQNINVAAILSIAGIGLYKTQVKIMACPQTKKNIHEIQVKSEAGNIFTHTENVLHPRNPKTSYLAVLSAMAVLRKILEPVVIGT